jgi:hypothetical protein
MTGFGKNLCAGILLVSVTVKSMVLPLISSPYSATPGAVRGLKPS